MKKILIGLLGVLVSYACCFQLVVSAKQDQEIKLIHEEQTLNQQLNKRVIPEKWNGQVRKIVYLTFDDGPSKNTEAILNILDRYHVKATFFQIGTNVLRRPELVKEIDVKGHFIGLHTMSHDKTMIYDESKPGALSQELLELQENIFKITNKKPILLRPPYGSKSNIKPTIANSLVSHHFKVWDWTVDSLDWKSKTVSEIMTRIQSETTSPVEVVLMHEKDISVEALPQVIEYYLANGYEFRPYDPTQHMIVNFLHDDRL